MNFFANFSHRKIKNGDIKEFERLFKTLYSPLCHFAFGFLKDMDAAEEVIQDLFYNYWKNRESTEITTSLKAYLYQATKNKCIKVIEHNTVRLKYATEIKSNSESYQEHTSDSIEAEELNTIIENTLNQLPQRCREIFVLSRFEGLKYHEIADKLSISIKTVEANMGKALSLFRVTLKQYNRQAC